ELLKSKHTKPDPYRKGVAGAGVGIVPFPRLQSGLVQINDDCPPGKKEKQHDDPQIIAVADKLEYEAKDSQEEGQHIQPVVGLVVDVDAVRQFALITKAGVVEE